MADGNPNRREGFPPSASFAPDARILIVKPSSLGDVVHTLPAVHALKTAWPRSRISWLVNTEWMPLLRGNPDLADLVEFPRGKFRGLRGLAKVPAWLATLRGVKPDLALDFQGLARSALLAKAAGAKRIYGLSNAREGATLCYHRKVEVGSQEHAVDRYLRLVADLGVPIEKPLHFPLPDGEKPAGVESDARYLLIHPFSRGEGKSLSVEALDALCRAVNPMRVVLAGRSDTPFAAPPNCTNLLNQTSIAQLIWLIRRARFTVSVDSGPMHIAAALSERLLGIHTWSDPRLVGPYNTNAWIWKGGEITRVGDLGQREINSSAPFEEKHVGAVAAFLSEFVQE